MNKQNRTDFQSVRKSGTRILILTTALFFFAVTAKPVYAYIGPGLGVGTITVVLGFFISILLALLGFIWYPIKRIIEKFKHGKHRPEKKDPSEGKLR